MEATATRSAAATRWRAALLLLVGASLASAPWSWVVDGPTPSFIVYPIVLLIGLWRMRKDGGTLYFGIAATVFLLIHAPWTWAAFTGADSNPLSSEDPAHPLEWSVTLFAVPLLTAIAGFAAWRDRSSHMKQGSA